MFLGWTYYGKQGYALIIEHAFDVARHLLNLLKRNQNFILVSKPPLPCLQVCFYWAKDGSLEAPDRNSLVTELIVRNLVQRGWMIDYAPGDRGKFFRVVVSISTRKETVEGLVKAIEDIASGI
jgi:glutamate/tyrosine decarboxylase-like PLP-dependent enzyme